MKITDICIIQTPTRNEVEIYRITDADRGTYRKYSNPTQATLDRILKLTPPATQPLIREADEDGWKHAKTWACAPYHYSRHEHPLLRRLYIDFSFR